MEKEKEKIMMRIYERDDNDFKDLAHWFWIGFNKKNTWSIVETGYPIFPIRVIICDKSEETEAHHFLHERNEKSKVKGTFWYEFTDGPFFVGMFVNTIEYYITDKIIPSMIEMLVEKKYYFITYKCKITTWRKVSMTQGNWQFTDSHEQTCQDVIDVHPIQFQLDCNEKYGDIEENEYKKRNEYFVLNWIPLTKEEYDEYKGKVG
jgi:hypothetical protein